MAALAKFLIEARRRRVFRSAGLYVVGAWVLLQVAALALQAFELPDGLLRFFWLAAFLGFPIALVFGWYYDIGKSGIRRTPKAAETDAAAYPLRIPDYLSIGALAIVAGVLSAGLFDRARVESTSLIYDSLGIAVLPLENLSGRDDEIYFTTGMQEALITSLSQISALQVVSRRSASSIDPGLTMAGIGETLGVRNIIEGSVLRDGDRVRIMVQLIDTTKDVQLWAGSFERRMTGILGLQNDIANSIANSIQIRLTENEKTSLASQPVVNADSYDAYLRAMYRIHDDSNVVRREGIAILKKAAENDPENALLHAGIAYGYALLGHSPLPEGMYAASKLSAARALALNDSLAEAHVAVGMQKMYYEWDFPAAENALLRALEINPSLTIAQYQYAWLMELYNDSDRALPPGELTAQLDPLNPFFLGWLANQYLVAGRYDDALAMVERTLEIAPNDSVAYMTKSQVHAALGEYDLALEASARLSEDPQWSFVHGVTLARAGDTQAAREILDGIQRSPHNVLPLVILHAALGDTDEMFAWLEVARDVKLPWYPWLITWYPETEPYRDDPRMLALAEEIGIGNILGEINARGH